MLAPCSGTASINNSHTTCIASMSFFWCLKVSYFLRGLRGMGYVLSKKALLQLAADLATHPLLDRMAAKVRYRDAK